MKKFILISFISIIMLNCRNKADDEIIDQERNTEIFMESVEILPQGRIKVSEGNFARIFVLNIFDPDYQPLTNFILNGEEFSDDGKFNDLVAGDGIYTSLVLRDTDVPRPQLKELSFSSEKFKYRDNELKGGGVKVGCDISHTRSGNSLLGFSCENWFGCFEFSNCRVELEFTW
jgi:hypothetical protein